MKTRARSRLTLLAGVALLSMVVFATAVQAAFAVRDAGSGVAFTETAALAGQHAGPAQASIVHDRLAAADVAAPLQAESSSISSTTLWIVVAVVAGLLLIGAWVLLRRRGASAAGAEENAFCMIHPEEAKCRAV